MTLIGEIYDVSREVRRIAPGTSTEGCFRVGTDRSMGHGFVHYVVLCRTPGGQFVTWTFVVRNDRDGLDYELHDGHYFPTMAEAKADFAKRMEYKLSNFAWGD